jgi:hypothetical protein
MKKLFLIFLIIPISAFADDLLVSDVQNGCSGSNKDIYLYATFALNQYQCNSGYYLPANTDHCVVCPSVYDCNGGIFTFNEEYDQGNKFKIQVSENITNGCKTNFLRAINKVSNITATFAPNVHNCAPGYYLPANVDECTKCLNDHYCPGGQLTFNETTPQGIIECPSNHPFAPAGMWLASQCGRKLHVGDNVLYMHQTPAHPTQHRLYTIFNGTVYSVNATPKQNGVADPKISAGMERSLHINLNGVEYLVHDDSVE